MDHIETKILNSYTIQEAAQNMVFAARLVLFATPPFWFTTAMTVAFFDIFLHLSFCCYPFAHSSPPSNFPCSHIMSYQCVIVSVYGVGSVIYRSQ